MFNRQQDLGGFGVLVSDLMRSDRIKVPLDAADKPSALRELVGLLAEEGSAEFNEILSAVEQREGLLSTGIGHGVAIPHGKCAGLDELALVAGASRQPIGFGAVDGEPVRLLFLLVGPERSAAQHVKALSRISRLARQPAFRDQLIHAASAREFHERVRAAER